MVNMTDEEIQRLKAMPLRHRCHAQAKAMGWYLDTATGKPRTTIAVRSILLIDGELSEAHEALRKDSMDRHLPHHKGFDVELADAWIRCMDTLSDWGMNLYTLHDYRDRDDVMDSNREGWIHRAKCDLWKPCVNPLSEPLRKGVDSTRMTIERAADCCNIPLMSIVRDKLDYNLTREDHQFKTRTGIGQKKW